MNLVEELLRIDKNEVLKKEEKKIKSKKLSKIAGEERYITIREISGKKITEFQSMPFDKKGNVDYSKTYDANLLVCVDGIIEPSMRDNTLMEHFGATTPKELVDILFGYESKKIADEIVALSGIEDDSEEEVKNS